MIRFSCPGCQAVYTVGPEKAGKTGKCPKCQSQFSIPKLDGAGMSAPTVPPPAPAPADPDAPVEIAPCPSCGTALTVATQYLGMDVECPTCKNVFAAKMPGGSKGGSSTTSALARTDAPADDEDDRPSKKKKRIVEDEDDEDRPSKKSKRIVDEDDEEDRPSKKSKRIVDEDDDEEDRPSKKSKRNDEDDAPRKKKKKKRTSGIECKKTTAGILAILVGGFGVHKFYLGYTTAGIIQLVVSLCTGVGFIIGTIEGIIYLTKTDEEFIETYQIGEKQWF